MLGVAVVYKYSEKNFKFFSLYLYTTATPSIFDFLSRGKMQHPNVHSVVVSMYCHHETVLFLCLNCFNLRVKVEVNLMCLGNASFALSYRF